MGHSNIYLNQRRAALLAGQDPRNFGKLCRRLGLLERVDGRPRIAVARLEQALGRTFAPEAIEAALRAPTQGYVPLATPLARKVQAGKARGDTKHSKLPTLDPGHIVKTIEWRDLIWRRWLAARDIHVEGPPLPDPCRADFATQDLFTREQVVELLSTAVRERDWQWRDWCDDALVRAQFPAGPPALDVSNLKGEPNGSHT